MCKKFQEVTQYDETRQGKTRQGKAQQSVQWNINIILFCPFVLYNVLCCPIQATNVPRTKTHVLFRCSVCTKVSFQVRSKCSGFVTKPVLRWGVVNISPNPQRGRFILQECTVAKSRNSRDTDRIFFKFNGFYAEINRLCKPFSILYVYLKLQKINLN